MRTTLLSLLFIFYGLNSHAQIVYTPFIPQENPPLLLETPRASPQPRSRPSTGINYSVPQVQNQSQIQEKIVRTTAYFLTQTGDCYKVPIRIALGSSNAKVISYYEDIGYGGSWKDVAYGGIYKNAIQCYRKMNWKSNSCIKRWLRVNGFISTPIQIYIRPLLPKLYINLLSNIGNLSNRKYR